MFGRVAGRGGMATGDGMSDQSLPRATGRAAGGSIRIFFDFRSPYAFFAAHRIASEYRDLVSPCSVQWCPVSIDILLNLQAGRFALAPYSDPLCRAKRQHLVADVQRHARRYAIPLRKPSRERPDSTIALTISLLLGARRQLHDGFRKAVFEALWTRQLDIADDAVLADSLAHDGIDLDIIREATSKTSLDLLVDASERAYASGVFGVPTFIVGAELYFGNDRMDFAIEDYARQRKAAAVG
jgi:2-hydroxychromene-2-carboxylate isomerase